MPGTVLRTCSIWRATRSISPRSVPNTLTPTGVRMPVESMSMRALIGMVQAFDTPGNCRALSISAMSELMVMPGRHSSLQACPFAISEVDRHAGRHCVLWLQVDDGFEHLGRRRIGRRGGAAGLAEHRSHLGKRLDNAVLHLQQVRRLGHRDTRQRRRHVKQRTLIEVGHELRAKLASGPERDGHDGERERDRECLGVEHRLDDRAIEPD